MRKRRWTLLEKRAAVERMKSCGHDKLALELKIGRRQLYAWRAQLHRIDNGLGSERGCSHDLEGENRRLKDLLVKKSLEVEFFSGALRRIEARRQPSNGTGETASTSKCE